MLKQQLKKRGCAGSQCMNGCTWAACGGSQGHLFSPRIFLGRLWLGSWLGTRFCTKCWGPGWQAGSHRFRVGSPRLRKQKQARSSRLLLLLEAVRRKAALCRLIFTLEASAGRSSSTETFPERPLSGLPGAAASAGTDPGEGWYLKNLLKGFLQALSE